MMSVYTTDDDYELPETDDTTPDTDDTTPDTDDTTPDTDDTPPDNDDAAGEGEYVGCFADPKESRSMEKEEISDSMTSAVSLTCSSGSIWGASACIEVWECHFFRRCLLATSSLSRERSASPCG